MRAVYVSLLAFAALPLSSAPLKVPAIGDSLPGFPDTSLVQTVRDSGEPTVIPPPPPPAPVDLIERIRADFQLTVPDEAAVRRELDWFRRHPDYLNRVFTRGERYLYHIVAELEAREMPVELALLPIVESAFDPFAYSHGRAAGLWQIIPGTGRRFGLKQNWWYDGRRDVVEATRAALDYLELLAGQFDGDWLLAIAAYNSGEGNVHKAMRRNRAAGQPLDFWHLRTRLPRETRAYVPRFLALAELVSDPHGYGVVLPPIADEATFASVPIGGQLDLALAAELAELDMDTLYVYNPAYNRWATAPGGPHRLVVPIGHAERFAERVAALAPEQRMRWQRHRVRDGETLSEIAERYGTSMRSIRSANKLRGNLIRAGRHLLVPASAREATAYTHSAEQRLKRTQNRPRDGEQLTHVVRRGESFWTIARQYGVGVRSLAKWNGMAPGDTLAAGRELTVWATAPAATVVPAVAVVAEPPGSAARVRRVHYTVRNGDNLSTIAARFRVRVADIARWNKLNTKAILRPGQRLTMYVDVTRQSS